MAILLFVVISAAVVVFDVKAIAPVLRHFGL
jgi:hypothetical protein